MEKAGKFLSTVSAVGLACVAVAFFYAVAQDGSKTLPYIDWLQDGHGKALIWILVLFLSLPGLVVGLLLFAIGRSRAIRREREAAAREREAAERKREAAARKRKAKAKGKARAAPSRAP